ncbi:hypothetical protein [Candidatus Lokiarchaeum ossiferum]
MSMLNYTIRRLLGVIPILFGVMLISFALTRAMPGNPYEYLLQNGKITDSTYQTYLDNKERLGLDLPLLPQFYKYFTSCMGTFWSIIIFAYMGILGARSIYRVGKYTKTKIDLRCKEAQKISTSAV